MRPHTFAVATREELWIAGRCVESRLEHGIAEHDGHTITAADTCDGELLANAERLIEQCGPAKSIGADQVRLIASSRRVGGTVRSESHITITVGGVAIVSSPTDVTGDLAWLLELLATKGEGLPPQLPVAWLSGSAAVLLHEAVGHAAEHGAAAARWPSWLRVRDEPDFAMDDCGVPARGADLLREPPTSMRCETFRDVPLKRMTRLVARQTCAPATLPAERIDVHVVTGGSYDPIADVVAVQVAVSDHVRRGVSTRLAPFTYVRSRAAVAESLRSGIGEPIRYPGVVCSREGQQLVVGSFAPVLVTE